MNVGPRPGSPEVAGVGLRVAAEGRLALSRVRRALGDGAPGALGAPGAPARVGTVLSVPGESVESLLGRADAEMHEATRHRATS